MIEQEEGKPYQRVMEKGGWTLGYIGEGIYNRGDDLLFVLIEELIGRPFDLSRDHKLRADLIDLGGGESVLVVVLHHIASDGWSMPIIVSELRELYGSYIEGRSARLPVLAVQYGDYALWQRRYLSGAVLDKQLAYWKDQLSGISPLILPTDRSRPAIQSNRGSVRQL